MKLKANRFIQRSLRKLRPDRVVYKGQTLPAAFLRTGGPEFKNNAFYLQSARYEAQRLIDHFGVTKTTPLLDIGCGFGRLAIGLRAVFDQVVYTGLDVNPIAIDWCLRYISHEQPDFKFICLDVQNDRYNPEGQLLNAKFHFPFVDASFSVAYLYSVFSHMVAAEIGVYLKELYRVLVPNGRLFFTAFAEEGVPDMDINPVDYGDFKWQAALHCVRYNYHFLESMLNSSGFYIDHFEHGQETNGQSGFYISKNLEN